VKLKLITETFLLPTNKAAIKKNGNASICLICGKDDETVEQLLYFHKPAFTIVVFNGELTSRNFFFYRTIA
jgi:hypothetical protein